MLSGADIPRMAPDAHAALRSRFGKVRGELERLLRDAVSQASFIGSIESGVPNISIRVQTDMGCESMGY